MWKYVLNKMIKQKEAAFFIVMIILSFAVSSAAPYLNGKFIDLLTVSKDIHLIVQFALIIVGVGVVGALLSYCSNLTTVKVLTKTTILMFKRSFGVTSVRGEEKPKHLIITHRFGYRLSSYVNISFSA